MACIGRMYMSKLARPGETTDCAITTKNSYSSGTQRGKDTEKYTVIKKCGEQERG